MRIKNNGTNPRWVGDVLLMPGEVGIVSDEIMALDAHKELLTLGILSEGGASVPDAPVPDAPRGTDRG